MSAPRPRPRHGKKAPPAPPPPAPRAARAAPDDARPVNVARSLELGARTIAEDIERIREEAQENGKLAASGAELLWKHIACLSGAQKSIDAAIAQDRNAYTGLSEAEIVTKLRAELASRCPPKPDAERVVELEAELRAIWARASTGAAT